MSAEESKSWIEIVVPTSVPLVEGVADHLVQSVEAARQGVQVRQADVVFWVALEQLEATLAAVRASLRGLADSGWAIQPDCVRSGSMAPEEDWRDAWKKYFHTTRLTRQFVVVPSWEEHEPGPDDIVIDLDPGQAFGTGAHASTQLVLEEVQDLVDSGDLSAPEAVFDLGTGSGILAIAAAKLWPGCRVLATDIDPMSIAAARENAKQNHVADAIELSAAELAELPGRFPLIFANIQAHILRALRDGILDHLAPGGSLLVSGILSTQIESLVEQYCEHPDLRCVSIRRSSLDPDWSSAHLRLA